jgi:hypothetical protein
VIPANKSINIQRKNISKMSEEENLAWHLVHNDPIADQIFDKKRDEISRKKSIQTKYQYRKMLNEIALETSMEMLKLHTSS